MERSLDLSVPVGLGCAKRVKSYRRQPGRPSGRLGAVRYVHPDVNYAGKVVYGAYHGVDFEPGVLDPDFRRAVELTFAL